jgi:Protein of unknown function (DUF2877)
MPGVADESLWPLLTGPERPADIVGVLSDAVHVQVGGVLVFVCGPTAVRLPGSITVPLPLADLGQLDDGNTATVGDGVARVGNITIEVRRWTAAPRPRIRNAAGAARRADTVAGRLPSLSPPVDRRTATLGGALRSGDADAVPAAVDRLIGLGPGLTPLGDDVLAGAALAQHAAGDPQRHVLARAIAAGRDRTTAVSAALLDAATAGRSIPQAAEFVSALDGRADLDEALSALLAVGSSSGAGLATGVALGVAALPRDDRSWRAGATIGAAPGSLWPEVRS